MRVLRRKVVVTWVVDPMIWVIEGDFPQRGIPVVGVFLAEGHYQGPRQGFFTRSGKVTDFREGEFKLDMIKGELL